MSTFLCKCELGKWFVFFLCEVFYLLNGKFIVGFFFCKVVLRGCYEVFEGGVCLKLFGFGLDIVRGLYFFVG